MLYDCYILLYTRPHTRGHHHSQVAAPSLGAFALSGWVSLRPVGAWLLCLLGRPSGWVPSRFALTSCWACWVRAFFCHRPGVWSFARFALTSAGLVGFCLRPGRVPGRFGLTSCWACWVLAPLWPGAPNLLFCWATTVATSTATKKPSTATAITRKPEEQEHEQEQKQEQRARA